MPNYQEIINSSGYPMQIQLARLIENTKSEHGWSVFVSEHRWEDPISKEEGFIDLILKHRNLNIRLVTECKRFTSSWIFLVPDLHPKETDRLKILSNNNLTGSLLWEEADLLPNSIESEFCIMETQNKKDSRTLEKIAGDLLVSMEHVAAKEWSLIESLILRDKVNNYSFPLLRYIPIIITSASLKIIKFDSFPNKSKVSEIQFKEENLASIDLIRFHKNFATKLDYDDSKVDTLRDLHHEYDRTVLVVQSENILEFLQKVSQGNL